jgi:hypothetical protein
VDGIQRCHKQSQCAEGYVCNISSQRCAPEVEVAEAEFAGSFDLVLTTSQDPQTGDLYYSAGASNVWARARYLGTDYLLADYAMFQVSNDGLSLLLSVAQGMRNNDKLNLMFVILIETGVIGEPMAISPYTGSPVPIYGNLDWYQYDETTGGFTYQPLAQMLSGTFIFNEFTTDLGESISGQFWGALGPPLSP